MRWVWCQLKGCWEAWSGLERVTVCVFFLVVTFAPVAALLLVDLAGWGQR